MKHLIPILLFCFLLPYACNSPKEKAIENITEPPYQSVNSVYYWKTVFELDSAALDFIAANNIGRLYLRMFDVVDDNLSHPISPEDATYPNATLRIDYDQSHLLNGLLRYMEIIPVVYVTLDALKAMENHEGVLAENIVTRVRNMVEYHELPNVSELQLDCDWTVSTEQSFFRLCDSVKKSILTLELNWDLSSTIRLHQLARQTPPVDRGVLMVYNTGSFNNPDARNSIIDINDIRPYIKRLPAYPLHLDIAYPTYSWLLLFRNRKFIGLINNLDLNDSTRFSHRADNRYVVVHDFPHNGKILHTGDLIRRETSDYSEIKAVKTLIEHSLSKKPHSNIIYHLDTRNLSTYSSDEIQNILSAGR